MTEQELQIKALLSTQLNLNPARYSLITQLYPNLFEAVKDKLQQILQLYADLNMGRFSNEENNNVETLGKILSDKWLGKIKQFQWSNFSTNLEKFYSNLERDSINILDWSEMPEAWHFLPDAPLLLYFQGNINSLILPALISVVGSRNLQPYTQQIITKIFAGLEHSNLGIVSGLAIGVDTLAHETALKQNLTCIGIIGSGLDSNNFHPTNNLNLKKRIIESGGLVLSEYPPGAKGMPYYFPQRNRLIASLGDFTWVVQANLKSGSLITANHAINYGKCVCTTPASVLDAYYAGNIKLLKEGAQVISEYEDLTNLLQLTKPNLNFSIKNKTPKPKNIQFESEIAANIYAKLTYAPQSIEEIVLSTKLSVQQLNTELSLMELEGQVANIGQNMWVKLE
ncbi:MAG: DNA-processing protein DprA [Patescibacteria group bacterium]